MLRIRLKVAIWITPKVLTERLENAWRAKVEAAGVHYSDTPSSEAKAAYVNLLKTFADLVLRGAAPEGSRWG
jgi:hypothetical protein